MSTGKVLTFLFIFLSGVFNLHAQECGIIYVSPNGLSAGQAGTRSNPASLLYGLSLVNPTNSIVWLSSGTYTIDNEILVADGVTIEGGFDPTTWVKSNATPSIIQRSNLNPLPAPANALVALAGLAAQSFTLQDLTIEVADAPPSTPANPFGVTVYGIYLNNCTNYSITRCTVITGAGSDGQPGANGTNGANGGNGANGQNGDPDNQNFNTDASLALGGPSPCGCNGGNGGNGGWSGNSNGTNGQQGVCGGGNGGNGGQDFCSGNCSHPNNSNGINGQNGANGLAGANGGIGPTGVVSNGYWTSGAQAASGATGGCGTGGGGGGGGGSESGFFCDDGSGADGGSGGGGGAGGIGGAGGYGGGSSFCIFVATNGANGIIRDCGLTAGTAGNGGVGGIGGIGGAGGIGGNGGGANCDVGDGGDGGNGGTGGIGGNGGTGANGLSAPLFEAPGIPLVATNNNGVPGNPPIISLDNYGCTNSEISFSATGGNGAWNFGSGANPQTANGNGPFAVTYPTIGRRTITYAGTTFTGFVGIFNDGPTLPTITPANPTVDAGCPNQFTTSLVGSQYGWDFGPVASPATESGASITTTSDVYFSTPGTYWIKVTVLTDCCGPVTDSTQVTVQQNVYDVTLTASATTICEGDPIVFTATPATYDNYEFFIDGISVQNGPLPVYTSSNIQQGDSIYIEAFVGSCFANPSDTIIPTVNPIPTVTLTSDDADNNVCAGEPITFTADPAGMDSYEFFNGSNSLQNGASNILFGTVPANNSITVVATDNGCPSAPSTAIVTQVNPIPFVTVTSSDPDNMICEGDNVVFTVLPLGMADYQFYEGVASVQSGVSNVYQTSSLVDGTDVFVLATSAEGCVGGQSNVVTTTVNPYPTVTLSSSDPDGEICEGESITFTAAPAGLDSYEFFDGATSVQNSDSETWTTTGLVTGNSVTVEATNLGCTSTASAAITTTLIAAPVVNPGSDIENCIDDADVTLTGFTPAGGTWSGTGITNATGVFSPSTAGAGSFTLSYEASNANCTTTETIVATVHDLPIVETGDYNPVCLGESVNLSASGAVTYVWNPPTDLSSTSVADPISTPTATIDYTVTGTDANGCVNTDITTVTVEPVPTASFTADDVCIGDTTTFVNTSQPATDVTYQWGFGNGQSSTLESPTHLYQAAGTYAAQLTVIWGNCSDATTEDVLVHPRPQSSFVATPNYTTAIEPLINFEDLSVSAVEWEWDFGDFTPLSSEQNPSHAYGDTGVHIISLVTFNEFGCTDTILDSVYIAPATTLYVPSAFTPDQDRINDSFKVFGEDVFWLDFRVFDRWGKQLFYTDDITIGWDGTDQKTGKEVKAGLYVYQVLYDDFRGRRLKKLGRVSLIR